MVSRRYAQWRTEDRDLRRLVDRLEDARREWEQNGRELNFLLSKGLIGLVKAQGDSLNSYLTPVLREFYERSVAHEREREAALEWARVERELRDRAKRLPTALWLRHIAENLAATIGLVRLNLQAKPGEELLGLVKDTLHQGMELARERNRFQGHQHFVTSVAFSPDGKTIVSGSNDRTIRLWRGGTWQDWLTICCDRIRYHPYFKNPQTEEARCLRPAPGWNIREQSAGSM